MIITAHGGSLGTGRNTYRYFGKMTGYKIDAIEVDIMKRGKILYLAHVVPALFARRAIPLSYVFEYCKKHNVMVNCDVKRKGLVKPVLELAKEMGAEQFIYFTGSVYHKEIDNLDGGIAYVNTSFYKRKFPLCLENLEKIKEYLDSFKNPRIKGINIPYRYASNEFVKKAKEIGLGLSIYTVDDAALLERLIPLCPDNITTNRIDLALALRGACDQNNEDRE
ncbi:MAG: glycerophosphodiester phosphodiesterase [Clostridia bacterium]|nr:glycerophosphodiester phosphodiesterase [Clostridia bacterium]